MIRPNKSTGGRIAREDTPWGTYRVEWDAAGNLVSHHIEIRTPTPPARPTHPIPDGYDPATQRQGCCDPPLDQTTLK